MYVYQNLLDIVVPAEPGDTDIHTFPQFKDWINTQFTLKTELNNQTTSYISKQSQIRSIKLKKGQSFDQSNRIKGSLQLNKKLSIAYNALNQIQQGREQLQNSAVASARGSRMSNMRRASFGGGGGELGFDLRQNSIMGSHSAQSSISVNGYEQINQYELTKLLGKGSFADVFLGIDTESQNSQKYAVKVLCNKKIKKRLLLKKSSQMLDRPPSPQPDQDETSSPKQQSLADMFVRNQVAILKKVAHQYITKLHDVIVDNIQQKVYLVLDYCGGGFIGENKERKGEYRKLLESQCKRYCRQLAQALDYIHNVAKIAHRDIKPENVLLNEHDEVKLSDFGLGTHKIIGKMSAGTPLYMPPEVNMEGSKQASDIWALGVTILVLLSGKQPQFKNQRIDPAAEMSKLKDISEHCRDFLNRCLEADVDKRIKAGGLLDHKWLASENLRQSFLSNKSIPLITVTEQQAANVISSRQDKKGGDSPTVFKIAVI